MGLIHVLSANLANKIAAGEVIERPASILKELVENSLDAGATRIDIALEAGGRQLIRVADDGAGMDGDDLAMSVLPHATSKLADEDDLFALHTMGFRGEALPSVGAVSQLRIVTRPKSGGDEQGYAIEVAGGEIGPNSVLTFNPGTGVYGYLKLMGFSQTVAGISDATGYGAIENTETETSGGAGKR